MTLNVEQLAQALDAPGVFEDPLDDAIGLARDIAREYAALVDGVTQPVVTSPFTEDERRLHFRCYKVALRIADAMSGGDKDAAIAELDALVTLVVERPEQGARA